MAWQSGNHKRIFKAISLVLAIALFFDIYPSYAYQNKTLFGTTSHARRYIKSETEENLLNIKNNPSVISIPNSIGQIVESYKGDGDAIVIHIQDCHVNEVAQLNIAQILKILAENYNVRLLSLEGASKKLDTSFYDAYPDTEIKEKISRVFVKKALFTGAEYFKITNRDLNISAFGAEDKDLYLRHLESYKDIQPDKEKIISYLNMLEGSLSRLKEYLYSKPLKELDRKNTQYRSKIITLADYAVYIEKSAKANRIKLDSYPNLLNFIELIKKEKKIDFKKAESQRKRLIGDLNKRLNEDGLRALLKASLDYRLNRISAAAFYDYLEQLMATTQYKLSAKNYAELIGYMDYIKLSSRINHLELFDEIDLLSRDIASGMSKNSDQQALYNFSENIIILKDLYALKLTSKKIEYINNNADEFGLLRISAFIKKLYDSFGLPISLTDTADFLSASDIKAANRFYQIATERDIALVDNTLKRLPYSANKTAILITGGFHTAGITNILKQKNISYVVICPNIGPQDYERLYAERIKGALPSYREIIKALSEMLVVPLNTGDVNVEGAKAAEDMFGNTYGAVKANSAGKFLWSRAARNLTLAGVVVGGGIVTGVKVVSRLSDRQLSSYPKTLTVPLKAEPAVIEDPAIAIMEHTLTPEQFENFEREYREVSRMIYRIFGNSISFEQQRLWKWLLIGTAARESRFSDRYSGKLRNGSGPYQITSAAADSVRHNWLVYPLAEPKGKTRRHRLYDSLTPLFAEFTNNRYPWEKVDKMTAEQIRNICGQCNKKGQEEERAFARYFALLSYFEKLERERGGIELRIPEGMSMQQFLAQTWKDLYNSKDGEGTVGGFLETYGNIYDDITALYALRMSKYIDMYSERTDPNQKWPEFIKQHGLDRELSAAVALLLLDKYNITPQNINSKLTPFQKLEGFEGIRYAQLKEANRIHIVITQIKTRPKVNLLICDKIADWAQHKEKASAEVDIGGELYRAVIEPLVKKSGASIKSNSAGNIIRSTDVEIPFRPRAYSQHYSEEASSNVEAILRAAGSAPSLNSVVVNLGSGVNPILPKQWSAINVDSSDIRLHIDAAGGTFYQADFLMEGPNFMTYLSKDPRVAGKKIEAFILYNMWDYIGIYSQGLAYFFAIEEMANRIVENALGAVWYTHMKTGQSIVMVEERRHRRLKGVIYTREDGEGPFEEVNPLDTYSELMKNIIGADPDGARAEVYRLFDKDKQLVALVYRKLPPLVKSNSAGEAKVIMGRFDNENKKAVEAVRGIVAEPAAISRSQHYPIIIERGLIEMQVMSAGILDALSDDKESGIILVLDVKRDELKRLQDNGIVPESKNIKSSEEVLGKYPDKREERLNAIAEQIKLDYRTGRGHIGIAANPIKDTEEDKAEFDRIFERLDTLHGVKVRTQYLNEQGIVSLHRIMEELFRSFFDPDPAKRNIAIEILKSLQTIEPILMNSIEAYRRIMDQVLYQA